MSEALPPQAFRLGMACVVLAVLLLHYPHAPEAVQGALGMSYALIERQVSVDSYYMAALAEIIVDDGGATWIIHPLSVFGLYPASYPGGVPHLLAGVSLATGLDVPAATFVVALVLAVALPLLGAAVALAMGYRRGSALVTAALLAVAPLLVYNTRWIDPKRVLIVAVYLLALWLLVRALVAPRREATWLVLGVALVALVAASVHRFFIVLPPLVVAFAAVKHGALLRGADQLRAARAILARPPIRATLRAGLVAALVVLPLTLFQGKVFTESYEDGAVEGGGLVTNLVNLVISIAGGAGPFALLLGAIGVVLLLVAKRLSIAERLLFAALVALLPFLTIRIYFRFIIAAWLALAAAIAVERLLRGRPRATVLVVAGVLLLGAPVALSLSSHWMETLSDLGVAGDEPYATRAEVEAAEYLRLHAPEDASFLAANWLQGLHLQAIAGVPNAPVVVGSPLVTNVIAENLTSEPLVFRAARPSEILGGSGSKTLYVFEGKYPTVDVLIHKDYTWIMSHGVNDRRSRELLEMYRVTHVVVDRNFDTRFTNWHSSFLSDSAFLKEVPSAYPRVFENEDIVIYEVKR